VRTARLTPVAIATPIVTHENTTLQRGLHYVGERAGKLAAEAEPLDQSQRHHQHAGCGAPCGIRRHQAHAQRGAGHHENRSEEHAAAPVPIAKVAEDDTAGRASQVAGREGRERNHQRDQGRWVREDGVGDVLREDTEDDEVVELERSAEAGQQHDAPARSADTCRVARRRRSKI
jgi:hypothetical protein